MMKRSQRNTLSIFFIVLLAILMLLFVYNVTDRKIAPASKVTLTKECPDAWFINMMPGPSDTKDTTETNRGYMIMNGQNISPSTVDISWVEEHCSINKPSPVY